MNPRSNATEAFKYLYSIVFIYLSNYFIQNYLQMRILQENKLLKAW